MECWSNVLTRITPLLNSITPAELLLRWGKPCPAFTAGLGFAVVTRW